MGYKEYNDYELIELVLEEDEVAKDILKNKYKPLIFLEAKKYYQYALGQHFHEVLLDDFLAFGEQALYSAVKSYDDRKGFLFYTYYLCCLRSKYTSLLRTLGSKKNQPLVHYQSFDYEVDDFCAISNATYDNPMMASHYFDLQQALSQYLYTISFLQQSVLELRINGFHYHEIMCLLHVSKDFVSKTIKKARIELKKLMN